MTEQEKQRKVRLTNIQRFCLHDGPGIRTTVFLKGCSIHCPWCANPENIRYDMEHWKLEDGTEGIFGYDITLADLEKEVMKDAVFYQDGGGITFSGGEPLLQIGRYEPLLRKLRQEDIHLAIETSLFAPQEQVHIAVQHFDWWYVDMKVLESDVCRRMLGGCIKQYLANLSLLAEKGVPLRIRIPCAHGITDTEENISRIIYWIQRLEIRDVEIFAVHGLAMEKYRRIGSQWTVDISNSEKALDKIEIKLQTAGICPQVIRI